MHTQPAVHVGSMSFIWYTAFFPLSFDCREPRPVSGNVVGCQSIVPYNPFSIVLSNPHIEEHIIDFQSHKYILSKLKGVQQQDEVVVGQRYISAAEVADWIFQFSI